MDNSDALSILATAAAPSPAVQDSDGSGASSPPTTTTDQPPPLPVVLGNTTITTTTPLAQFPLPLQMSLQNDLQIGRYLRLQQELNAARSELFNRSFATPITAAMPIQPAVPLALGDNDSKVAAITTDGPLNSTTLMAAAMAPRGFSSTASSIATAIRHPFLVAQQQQQQQQGNVVSDDNDEIIISKRIPFFKSMNERQQKEWIVQFSMDDVEVAYNTADRVEVGNGEPTILKSIDGVSPDFIRTKVLIKFIKKFKMRKYSKFRYKVQYCDRIATYKMNLDNKYLPLQQPIQQQQQHHYQQQQDTISNRAQHQQDAVNNTQQQDISIKVQQQDASSIRVQQHETNIRAQPQEINSRPQPQGTNIRAQPQDTSNIPQQQDTSNIARQQDTSNRAQQLDIGSRAQQQDTSSKAERAPKRRRSTKSSELDVFGMHVNRVNKAANNKRTKVQREQAATFLAFAQEKHVMEKWEIASNNLSTAWAELRRLKGVVGLNDLADEVIEVKKDVGMWKALKERYRLELMEKDEPCAIVQGSFPVPNVAIAATSPTSSISSQSGKKNVIQLLDSSDSSSDDD